MQNLITKAIGSYKGIIDSLISLLKKKSHEKKTYENRKNSTFHYNPRTYPTRPTLKTTEYPLLKLPTVCQENAENPEHKYSTLKVTKNCSRSSSPPSRIVTYSPIQIEPQSNPPACRAPKRRKYEKMEEETTYNTTDSQTTRKEERFTQTTERKQPTIQYPSKILKNEEVPKMSGSANKSKPNLNESLPKNEKPITKKIITPKKKQISIHEQSNKPR